MMIKPESICEQFVVWAQQALDAWDGQDTTDFLVLLCQEFGLSLHEMRNLIQAKMDQEAEAYRCETVVAEGEKAFEAGGQEWADWNMANNPFGD